MDPSTILIFVLMGLFIGLLFLGVPVGFSLGGSAMAVTTIAVVLDEVFGVYTGLSYLRFSITVDRVFGIMSRHDGEDARHVRHTLGHRPERVEPR